MQRHHEVRLTSRTLPARDILLACLRFAKAADGWEPHSSGLHEKGGGIGAHCMLVHTGPPAAGMALVADHENPRALNVTNIVPRDIGHLEVEPYNRIAKRFVTDFRRFARRERLEVKVKLTAFKLSFEAAIPSPRCREFFRRYLAHFPRSFHPCDVERLDTFICALHRFNGSVDLEALSAYLVTQRQWTAQDARIVCERIRVGRDVLAANARF
jgi:hypothetical protein